MTDQKRIGIMGGTFDPIHIGHLFAAEAARDAFSLNRVLFVPTGDPPHKRNSRLASGEDRLRMIQMAIDDNPAFILDSREIQREGTTYTIDTLRELKEEHPHDTLFFIIGGDTLLELKNWREFSAVAGLCSFIVYQRPGYHIQEQREEALFLQSSFRADIHFITGPHLEISSENIRRRLKDNLTIKYLVQEEVVIYITEHKIYKGE